MSEKPESQINLIAETLDLLVEVGLYDDSYCDVCERHAPRDFLTGDLVGPVPHLPTCVIRRLTAVSRAVAASYELQPTNHAAAVSWLYRALTSGH